jgi:hypothetical protein
MTIAAMGADGNGGRGETFSNHSENGVFVYIVQRSGYAGWQQSQPPVDYRRLLMTRAEADQVAYGSAHHFANGGPVRTIQLPDGSFGSVSSNYLFWVRKVSATSTTASGASTNNATGGGANKVVFGEAHCVLSDGLLGGTSKRRNMLVAEKHSIFVGPHSSHAALQYLTSHRSLAEKGATIQWVPVGLPPSLDQLAQEWPMAVGMTTTTIHAPPGSTTMDVSESSLRSTSSSRSSKRAGDDDDNVVWFHHPNNTNYPPRAVDMMETARSTKRACWARSHTAEGMVIE